MKRTSLLLALALSASALRSIPARADDAAPADEDPAKREARALMREGVRLLGTGDNAGALALFQSAYAKFPSAKILLNIGSTLKTMGRSAEAANAYQRYLDAADTDPAKKAEVDAQLATLDAQLARLTIAIDVPDAELQIEGAWVPASKVTIVRVAPGPYELHARKHGLPDAVAKGEVAAGATATATITMLPRPKAPELPVVPKPVEPVVTKPIEQPGPALGAAAGPEQPSPFGGLVHLVGDIKGRGGAAMVGGVYDLGDRVELEAGALIGPTIGAYAGGVGYLGGGALRPRIGAGVPIFFSAGARVGLRAAAGVEWRTTPHLAVVAELGVEHYLNAEGDIDATAVTPIVGVNGRL